MIGLIIMAWDMPGRAISLAIFGTSAVILTLPAVFYTSPMALLWYLHDLRNSTTLRFTY
jgi:hypothetical protein